MAIDQTKKSNRLLGSRRFTSDALNTSQEAFQSVLDIRANEIYTEANLIPTSSLPNTIGFLSLTAVFPK